MKKCCNRLRLRAGVGVDENLPTPTPTPVKTTDSDSDSAALILTDACWTIEQFDVGWPIQQGGSTERKDIVAEQLEQ